MTPQEQQQLEALIAENQRLKEQAVNLADANVYAAELLAALEEAHDRERELVQRGEELELQTRLDLVLQEERENRGDIIQDWYQTVKDRHPEQILDDDFTMLAASFRDRSEPSLA